ncbi:MAG: trypsin-like peptidase domain-containing protein [Phycisphaerales bacterium]|nr:trypsin-like peptidase domain-containing protein [Phycisphaerales bacterium]
MQTRRALRLALIACAGFTASVSAQMDPLPSHFAPVGVDSGVVTHSGLGEAAEVVYSAEVFVPDALWLRLFFDEAELAGTPGIDGSYLKIHSLEDGAVQRLDGVHVQNWSMSSAYFNGESVYIELWAYPETGPNRLVVREAEAGEADGPGVDSICDGQDDRDLAYDPRVARLSNGCTSWLINHGGSANRMLTAGHCIANNSTGRVVFFNVPLSSSSGAFRAPPPEYQYPVQDDSIQSNGSGGVGNDVATFQVHVNSNTGLAPRVAQGAVFELAAAAPPANNQEVRVTGFGRRDANFPQIPEEWSRTQKTHTGPLTSRGATWLRYRPDTTGGNSGSPVILESTGQAIAIHTHGGCNATGGANAGSAIEHPTLQAYLANPQGFSVPYVPLDCIQTTFASNNGGEAGGAVYFDVQIASAPVFVRAIELNTGSDRSTEFGVSVYRTDGSAEGRQTDPSEWTLVGEGWGLATGQDNPTRVVLDTPFALDANSSYGLAIVLDGASHRYTIGDGTNEQYSNDDLTLTTGWATNGAFSGTVFGPRVFNGTLCYEPPPDWIIGNLPGNDAARSTNLRSGRVKAMGFTMPAGDDYEFEDAELRLEFDGTANTPFVRIFDDAGGAPGQSLGTLENPVITPGINTHTFTPQSPILFEGGETYWLVVYSNGNDAMHWTASDPPQLPSGLASHAGSLWSGSTGPNPPNASDTSSFINGYAIYASPVPGCPADLNGDGVVDADDFFLFLQLFADGDPIADINNDGVIDADDFFEYLGLFAQGC